MDTIYEAVTLPVEKKDWLFSQAISSIQRNADETNLVLDNLQRWAPEMAQAFDKRTADTILQTPFRILQERTSTEQVPASSYLCVSYCWQAPEFAGSGLQPAAPFPFSQPFVDGLLELRADPSEGMWIDQMCIRQEDEAEKLQAIAAMGKCTVHQMQSLLLTERSLPCRHRVQVLPEYGNLTRRLASGRARGRGGQKVRQCEAHVQRELGAGGGGRGAARFALWQGAQDEMVV